MAAERVPMRKLREILRLKLECGLRTRAIARSCKLSVSTVSGYLGRAQVAKLGWPLPPELDDDRALTRLLFPDEGKPVFGRPEPDYAWIHRELRRKHVTRALLWQEYREQHDDGYEYSQFCERYGRWAKTLPVTMRQEHRAGEKLFVDFSGDGLDIVDVVTGECRPATLFVAVLGASNLTYVEPVLSEDLPTWIGCHVRAFSYLGGVAEITIPDNLKSGVTRPDYYDPEINPTYAELARHYGTAIIPARVRKPRDKAKVEVGVQIASRWILAVLRHRSFHSLDELREAIRPLVERLNARPLRKIGKSRRALFEELERPALRPLPTQPYELACWAKPRVNIDYHVEFERHYYSVPHALRGTIVHLRATEATSELCCSGERITSHLRSDVAHRYTTKPEHMPRAHREYLEWTPSRIMAWANTVGPSAAALVGEIMRRRPHPEQGYRSCLGVMRLVKTYPAERVERACARAITYRAYSRKSVAAILKNNLDRQDDAEPDQRALPLHQNVRGARYYH